MGFNTWERTIKGISGYCKNNIWNYEERVTHALGKMDRFRYPLQHADPILFSEINEMINEYCLDYDVDQDAVVIDIEDILFA